MGITHNFKIDRRIRAREFMALLSIGRTKFYRMIKKR